MKEVGGTDLRAPIEGILSGHLVPSVRNRAVGRESSAAVERADGGLQISVETELAFNDLALRQSVVASFDEALRPEWCRVDATVNSRTLQVAIDIGAHDTIVRICADAGDEERTIPLRGRPLLLVDNCFTLHALAAWSAVCGDRSGRPDRESDIWTALPIGHDLSVSNPVQGRVILGGIDLGTPSMTLRLGPDLDEHLWFVDNRFERLAIPRLHVRVDRVNARTIKGERQCTTR